MRTTIVPITVAVAMAVGCQRSPESSPTFPPAPARSPQAPADRPATRLERVRVRLAEVERSIPDRARELEGLRQEAAFLRQAIRDLEQGAPEPVPTLWMVESLPAGDYDLAVTEGTYTPRMVRVGDEVTFHFTVANLGTSRVPDYSHTAYLYVGDRRVSTDLEVSGVPPGGGSTWYNLVGQRPFKPSAPGQYRFRFVLDEEGRLSERDKRNNVFEGTIVVEPDA